MVLPTFFNTCSTYYYYYHLKSLMSVKYQFNTYNQISVLISISNQTSHICFKELQPVLGGDCSSCDFEAVGDAEEVMEGLGIGLLLRKQ